MSSSPVRSPRWPGRVVMLVTHPTRGGRPLAEVVEAAVEAGAGAVQLRDRTAPAGELLALARRLRGITAGRALLLVNDRADAALLAGADGVHLPENGLPVAAVRSLLPPGMLVGRSVHSIQAARQAELDGADYLVAGPLYATPTHPDREPAGLALLEEIAARVSLPVVGIGGIGPHNAGEVWAAGAAGIASVGAILEAEDPGAAVRALLPPAGEDSGCG